MDEPEIPTRFVEEKKFLLTRKDSFKKYEDSFEDPIRVIPSPDKIILVLPDKEFGQIIVKSNIHPDALNHAQEILHEGFVGLYGLNLINSPYFAKVVDAYTDKDCINKEGKCNYVIYEYVPGKPIHKILQQINVKEFKLILLQLFLALYDANRRLKFTHHDLHPNNIIVKQQDWDFRLPSGKKVHTLYVPVVIDYGASYVEIDGIGHSRSSYEGDFWVADVYRILSMLYDHVDIATALNLIKMRLEERLNSDPDDYTIEENIDDKINELILDIQSTEDEEEKSDLEETLQRVRQYKEDSIEEYESDKAEIEKNIEEKKKMSAVIESLLKFFGPDFDRRVHEMNREKSEYFILSNTDKDKNLSFDKFIEYTLPILT